LKKIVADKTVTIEERGYLWHLVSLARPNGCVPIWEVTGRKQLCHSRDLN